MMSNVPTSPQRAAPRTGFAVFLLLCACLAAIFYLPYFVPVRPGSSISAMAGFNNTAAIALLLLSTAAFGWFNRTVPLTFPTNTPRTLQDRRSRLLLAAVLLAIATVCTLLWLAQRGKGGAGELTFFAPFYENYRLGLRFYRDLDFPYGPLLAYSPVVAAHLSGLSLFDGYHLAWLLQSLLGVYFLYKTVGLLGIATTARARALFLLLTAFFYTQLYSEGIQYTPVRFFLAPLLALSIDRLYRQDATPWKVFLLAALGNAALVFYSPEHGIQFFLGTLLFFVLCAQKRPGTWLALALFTALFALWIALAGRMGVLGFFFRTSGGALNLPLLFGLPTLAAVLFVLAAGVLVFAARQQHRLDHPWVYLVALSVITLPVALGRCDPGHLFINLVGAFLAVFAALSSRRAPFGLACVLFVSLFARDFTVRTIHALPELARDGLRQAVTEPTPLHALARRYTRYLSRRNGPAAAAAMQREHTLTAAPQPGTPLPEGTDFFAPLGATFTLPRPAGNPRIFTGSYPGLGIYAPYDEAEKRRILHAFPNRLVLLPDHWQSQCTYDDRTFAFMRADLRWIFQTPLVPQLRPQPSSWQPFCTWLAQNYTLTTDASPLPQMRVYRHLRQ